MYNSGGVSSLADPLPPPPAILSLALHVLGDFSPLLNQHTASGNVFLLHGR